MANRETSSNVTGTDNDTQRTVEGDISSDEERSTEPTTDLHENVPHNDVHDDDDRDDNSESIVDPPAHSRTIKKKKIVDNRKMKADINSLLRQSIANHEERAKHRALERKKLEDKLGQEERDPLYRFFMAMYATTAKMPPASQHMIKREVFRIVSDTEETLLGMSPHSQGHSSHSSYGSTPLACTTPTDPSTADTSQSHPMCSQEHQDASHDFTSNYFML